MKHPQTARHAAYELGCLLYDNQPENAIKAWEESRRRDDKFALTHRNLALAYAQHEKNIPKAIASLDKAIELNPTEARFSTNSTRNTKPLAHPWPGVWRCSRSTKTRWPNATTP